MYLRIMMQSSGLTPLSVSHAKRPLRCWHWRLVVQGLRYHWQDFRPTSATPTQGYTTTSPPTWLSSRQHQCLVEASWLLSTLRKCLLILLNGWYGVRVWCAFTKKCMVAGTVLGCPHPNNFFNHWVGCHRYDLSAINLILLHHFKGDIGRFTCFTVPRFLDQVGLSYWHVGLSKISYRLLYIHCMFII